MGTFSLDIAPPEQPKTFSLDTGEPASVPVPQDIAERKTQDLVFSYPDLKMPTYEEIQRRISSGDEANLRKELSAEVDARKTALRQEAIINIAKQVGRPLTEQDIAEIDRNINTPEPAGWPTDPRSVAEVGFAKETMSYFSALNPKLPSGPNFDWSDTVLHKVEQEQPGLVKRDKEIGEHWLATSGYIKTRLIKAQQDLENQDKTSWFIDQVKTLFPGVSQKQMRWNNSGTPFYSNVFTGNQLEEQATNIFGRNFQDAKDIVDQVLEGQDPSTQVRWLEAMLGQSRRDKLLTNALDILDATAIGGVVARLVMKAYSAVVRPMQMKVAVKDMIQEVMRNEEPKVGIAEGLGNTPERAVQQVTTDTVKELKGTINPAKESVESLFDNFDKGTAALDKGNPPVLGIGLTNMLKEKRDRFKDALGTMVATMARVERIPAAQALEKVIRVMGEDLEREYPALGNSMLNKSAPFKDATGAWWVEHYYGKGARLFDSKASAVGWKNGNGIKTGIITDEDSIGQKGLGWYLKVNRPLNETQGFIMDELLSTSQSKSPFSMVNAFIGRFRTPNDVLSQDHNMNRFVATYGANVAYKIATDVLEDYNKAFKWSLPGTAKRERWKQFQQTLDANRDMADPDNPALKGYLFKSPAELDIHYQQHFGRTALEIEHKAYESIKMVGEMEKFLRNAHIVKEKNRLGTLQHQFSVKDEYNKAVKSPFFEAVPMREAPTSKGGKLILGSKLGEERVVYGAITGEEAEAIKNGTRVVARVIEPNNRPLRGFGNLTDEHIEYVVGDSMTTKPISLNQVQGNTPWLFENQYPFYLKQGIVTAQEDRWLYEGDRTLSAGLNRAELQIVADRMNQVKDLIKDNKIFQARALFKSVDKNGAQFLPGEWLEFLGKFRWSKDANGAKKPPELSFHEPIQVGTRDQLLIEEGKHTIEDRYVGKNFEDVSRPKSLYNPSKNITYSGDAYETFNTVRDVGTRHNPSFINEPAQYINPISAMNRSMARIINSTFMDDYKHFAVSHWLAEAKNYINATEQQLKAAPLYWFYKGDFVKGPEGDLIKRQLEVQRMQIQQFMGTKSSHDALLHSFAQKLSDSVYKGLGPTASRWIDPLEKLPFVQDPFRFLRSITFHAKLGLFSIPQFIVQNQTYALIYGIAGPEKATQGALMSLLQQYSRLNKSEAIMQGMDKVAVKFGMKPGEFIEASRYLDGTGFGHVGNEYALLDTHFVPNLVKSGFKTFLDAGAFPFREGERSIRYGAWFTAFREFRAANPTGRITDTNVREILARADLLSANMSRASSAAFAKGAFSVTTQFINYQLRLAEIFMGKRLGDTMAERMATRARIATFYAGLYGVPGAVGAATAIPFGDYFRKNAIDNGYNVGENYVSTLVDQGIPASLLGWSAGRFWNIPERYGSPGLDVIRQGMRTDTTMWKMVGGALGSTLVDGWAASDDFRAAVVSMLRRDGKFEMQLDNVLDPLSQISTVGQWRKFYEMANTGRVISAKGNWLTGDNETKISKVEAFLSTVSGLSPQSSVDTHLKTEILKDIKESKRVAEESVKQGLKRGLRDAMDGNPDQATKTWNNALNHFIRSGHTPEEQAEIISQGFKDQPLDKAVDWSLYGSKKGVSPDFDALDRAKQLGSKK